MEKVRLTIGGEAVGECDTETFELVKMYLAEGRNPTEIVRELKLCSIKHALAIVACARRELWP